MFCCNNYAVQDRLKDDSLVTVRAVQAQDKPLLQQIMSQVSAECRYFRFFTAKNHLTDSELKYFTEVDFDTHIALVVLQNKDGLEQPLAVGRYVSAETGNGRTSAELALLVSENYQRLGVGSMLFKHLAQIATAKGIAEFVCYILPENRPMLRLLQHTKYGQVAQKGGSDSLEVTVQLQKAG